MTAAQIVLAAFMAIFNDGDVDQTRALVAEDYIQHNPHVPTGRAPVEQMLPALKESGLSVTTHRILSEGDLVVMHNTYENAEMFGAPTLVGFDVFRVENGKVAEHWDNLQVPPATTVSGRTMTDGPTEVTDLDQTAQNKALVEEFVDVVLTKGDASNVTKYISTQQYDQHNLGVGDGLEGLGAALHAMAEAGVTMVYSSTPIVIAEGNFVFTASEGTMGDQATAFYDLFRLEGGKIVEHWDVMAEIPPADQFAHENGKF